MKRDRYCARVTEEDIDKSLGFMGWVQNIRDMGGIIFLDLRDKTGILQVVCDAENLDLETFKKVESIRNEYVIAVKGDIRKRDIETYNDKLPTGTIELKAMEVEILSKAKTLPFQIEENVNLREELRLKHRYLDLRKPSLYNNLVLRHSTLKVIRRFLEDREFLEVETPILTKSTPEGARDYLVPSRLHKGSFYALPQSPQIFKQLLMVSGVDKYYQVAKCFRDEDLRSDRQPEFTQVDMELSFTSEEEILVYLEEMFKDIFKTVLDIDIKEAFRRITYKDAIDLYGSDKPDIRFAMEMVDLSETLRDTEFKVFKDALNKGKIKAINIKGGYSFTRAQIDDLTQKAIDYGAKGMAWIALDDEGQIRSILTKYFSQETMKELLEKMDAKAGDLIIFSADTIDIVNKTLGGLRLDVGDMLGLRNKDDFKFAIVTDFPLFEWSKDQGRLVSMHHPFTMMNEEDIPLLDSDPANVRAKSYDVVLNGVELGSGSIRIHKSHIQKKMFEVLGLSQEDIEDRFGFILEAFSYGTPPHGGFAFGLDRLVMMMAKEDTIREVIAFPKTREGICPLSQAPSSVDSKQLKELDFMQNIQETPLEKEKEEKENLKIENLAINSYIYLEDEKEIYEKYLLDMIKETENIKEIDVKDYSPTINIHPIENSFREDKVEKEFTREELLQDANKTYQGYIRLENKSK